MPNNSSLLAVQTALYGVLSTDATLLTLCPDVLNFEPPSDPPERFLLIGNAIERSWNTLGGLSAGWGWRCEVTVHIYSYNRGEIEALQILSRVTALLNFQPLTVTGYPTAIVEYGEPGTKVLVETKDKRERRHIPAIFTVLVHE